jgi:hypothetical protein
VGRARGFHGSLTEEGVVVLGGPIGEGDGDDSLLVVDVESEAAIRAASPTTRGRTTC